jgi:hypothetical protein
MSKLICPVSAETIDKGASRVGAGLTATMLVVYAVTGWWPLLILVVADYVVRVGTSWRSPIAWAGRATVRLAHLDP